MLQEDASRPKAPRLVGGAACLDFVNTVGYRGREDGRDERLPDYAALAAWAERVGILEAPEAARARAAALADPARAEAVVAEARALREAIARLFQGRPRADDLDLVNGFLAQAPRAGLMRQGAGFGWGTDADPLRAPLWPVLWNAADLMTGAERDRVRCCADPECRWMFLDTARNRPRLWCSMDDCGNRAKARRHYQRAKRAS
jgi:predicted RNA-binding Zn ribbon-like protein